MHYSLFTRISIVVFVLSFAGCAGLEKHIQTPTVHFAGSKIKNASLYDASIDFLIRVDNPNPIALPIHGLNYTVDINGTKMLSGSAQPGTELAAKTDTELTVPVVVRYEEFLDGLQQLVREDSFTYSIKGDIDLGFFKLPYNAGGTIDLPDLPQVKLKTINVKKISFNGIETAMQFSISNSNDFPINANSLSYEILLNKIATVSGKNTEVINIPPQSDGTVEVISTIGLLELGKVLDSLKQDSSINTTVKGEINIPTLGNETKNIPFSWSGETAIMR